MQKSRVDVWVGLFVLIGAAAVLFLALKAGNLLSLSFAETYPVTARFDNIGGLKNGAAVKSAGVVVGRVQSIQFNDKAFQADVVMQLEKRFAFPSDSSAMILTSGLLGEQYVGLGIGGSEKNLAAGSVITQTQSAVVLETLISQFLFNKAADASDSTAGKPAAPANDPLAAPLPAVGASK